MGSRFPNGQPIYLSTTLTNRAGALTDDATLALTIQNPDLTTQNFASPTHDGTGLYHQDVSAANLSQSGHYQYKWISTGAAAGVSFGEFDVFDPFEPSVISLQEAKQAVNIPQATTTYDDELLAYVETVTAALETITGGPAYTRSISERVRVRDQYEILPLSYRPVVAITSVTDIASGSVMSISDIEVDTVNGLVRRKRELSFWSWGPFYQVVYTAGWGTSIPAAFNIAARLIVTQLWKTARGPGQAPVPMADGMLYPGLSFAIPPVALEVMRPYTQEVYF